MSATLTRQAYTAPALTPRPLVNSVLHGDALEALRTLPDNSVDAVVTDPPAGINFMNMSFDSDKGGRDAWIAWLEAIMREALRVTKPGGHALIWALPRTSHWTATALEDAGWEIRDVIAHLQGQGFPKSLNVTKAVLETGKACQCRKDVVYLKEKEEVSHVKTALQASTDLSELQSIILSQESQNIESMSLLFSQVLRGMEGDQSRNTRTTQENSGQRSGGLVGRNERTISAQEYGGKQSGMEGWHHAQENAWQLSGGDVRSLSTGIPSNGTQGWVCDATSSSYGSISGEMLRESGSSASHRPQSTQQRHQQSAIIPQQFGPQTCGSCGKKIIPEGLGTSLKPSHENWILCRKPLAEQTVAANVLRYGTGGLNIDASRIGTSEDTTVRHNSSSSSYMTGRIGEVQPVQMPYTTGSTQGRFPSNTLFSHTLLCEHVGTKQIKSNERPNCTGKDYTGSSPSPMNRAKDKQDTRAYAAYYADSDGLEEVDAWECVPDCPVFQLSLQSGRRNSHGSTRGSTFGGVFGNGKAVTSPIREGDEGTAARYFAQFAPDLDDIVPFAYFSKPSRKERNAGLSDLPAHASNRYGSMHGTPEHGPKYDTPEQNHHPTVKSLQLMRYLVTMICPPGGIVLDMFAGSGSTLVAAVQGGYRFIGIEAEAEYVAIAEARLRYARGEVE